MLFAHFLNIFEYPYPGLENLAGNYRKQFDEKMEKNKNNNLISIWWLLKRWRYSFLWSFSPSSFSQKSSRNNDSWMTWQFFFFCFVLFFDEIQGSQALSLFFFLPNKRQRLHTWATISLLRKKSTIGSRKTCEND